MKNPFSRRRWFAFLALICAILAVALGSPQAEAQVQLPPSERERPVPQGPLTLPAPTSSDPAAPSHADASRTAAEYGLPGEAVRERKRPAYDPVGIKVGGFTLLPNAGIGVGYDSNPLSQPGGSSDVHAIVSVGGALRSNWSGHQLNFDLGAAGRQFAGGTREGGIGYRASVDGKLEISQGEALRGRLSHEHILADRSSIEETLITSHPVRYDRTAAEISADFERGRFRGEASFGWTRHDFQNSLSSTGREINLQYRDFEQRRAGLEVGYHMTPTKLVFLGVNADRREHRLVATPQRDSRALEAIAGIRGGITPLIRGQIGVSYLAVDFLDPSIRSRKGFGLDAELQYLLTELTTINVSARRTLRNAASPSSPAAFTTRFSLGADHELRRNVILSATATREQADYVASNEKSTITRFVTGATWLINRRFSAGGEVGYRVRNDKNFVTDRDHSAFTAAVTLNWRM